MLQKVLPLQKAPEENRLQRKLEYFCFPFVPAIVLVAGFVQARLAGLQAQQTMTLVVCPRGRGNRLCMCAMPNPEQELVRAEAVEVLQLVPVLPAEVALELVLYKVVVAVVAEGLLLSLERVEATQPEPRPSSFLR